MIEEKKEEAYRPIWKICPGDKRYCETCKRDKPKGKYKAVKGWKCDDCRSEK
jgi:hypothetical protein